MSPKIEEKPKTTSQKNADDDKITNTPLRCYYYYLDIAITSDSFLQVDASISFPSYIKKESLMGRTRRSGGAIAKSNDIADPPVDEVHPPY